MMNYKTSMYSNNHFDRHFHRVQPVSLRDIPWKTEDNLGDRAVFWVCLVLFLVMLIGG